MKLKNSALQELYDVIVNGTLTFSPYEECPIDKAFRECDEKLQKDIDIWKCGNEILAFANTDLASNKRKLEKEIDYLKKDKKQLEEALEDTKTTLVKANSDRTNLQEAFDKLSGENRWLNARIDCLRLEVNWYRKHYKEQSDKILGLKSRLNSMCGDEYIKKLQDSVRDIGYKQGQKDLWDMLREVSDYYYFGGDDEFDTDDCEMTSMTDIIDNLNVNQFLEAYKSLRHQDR